MQELLGILCNEKTDGLSLERAKIFGKVWRSCLPEDSDEKTRKLLRSKTWLDMLDALRDDILSVLDSVGKKYRQTCNAQRSHAEGRWPCPSDKHS